MSSHWGERDEAQLLESYLWLRVHSRKQSLLRWLGRVLDSGGSAEGSSGVLWSCTAGTLW